jgi:hypothetical protein
MTVYLGDDGYHDWIIEEISILKQGEGPWVLTLQVKSLSGAKHRIAFHASDWIGASLAAVVANESQVAAISEEEKLPIAWKANVTTHRAYAIVLSSGSILQLFSRPPTITRTT